MIKYGEDVKPITEKKTTSKLYVRLKTHDEALLKRVGALVGIFDGNIPVIIFVEDEKKQFRLVGASAGSSPELITKLEKLVGKENVVLK